MNVSPAKLQTKKYVAGQQSQMPLSTLEQLMRTSVGTTEEDTDSSCRCKKQRSVVRPIDFGRGDVLEGHWEETDEWWPATMRSINNKEWYNWSIARTQ